MQTREANTFSRQALPCLLALAWFFTAAGATPRTAAADVALVTKVSGQATYWNQGERQSPAPVQAFMKVRQGDRFKLPEGSTLTLLYFASGRQESWKGPVILAAGGESSQTEGGEGPAPQPEVKLLPSRVSKRMDCAPLPLPRSGVRYYGGIQTMAPLCAEARQELKDAEATYRNLRQQAPAEDLTPELYYLGVLAEYQQYGEMDSVLDTMLKTRPGDKVLKDLKAWVRSQPAAQR